LLVAHRENRRLLADWLATRYQVLLPESDQALAEPFDLGIIDGPALDRLGKWGQALKKAARPSFLPFLLGTHRQGMGGGARPLGEGVADLIIGPMERGELQAGVEILWGGGQLSLQTAPLTRQLEAELARAGAVQAELLPREVPTLPGFELAARCIPAREVGG